MNTLRKYHIKIEDLVTGTEEGFMLGLTKGQLPISTLPAVVPKQSQGEVTMGDLSNSSVFVQYSWAGQSTSDGGYNVPAGPAGVKYWTPTVNYSDTLPTTSYWKSAGVNTIEQAGEIRLTYGITEEVFTGVDGSVNCSVQDGDILYIGTSTGKIYSKDGSGPWVEIASFTDSVDSMLLKISGKIKALIITHGNNVGKIVLNGGYYEKGIDWMRHAAGQSETLSMVDVADSITLNAVPVAASVNYNNKFFSLHTSAADNCTFTKLDDKVYIIEFDINDTETMQYIQGLVGTRLVYDELGGDLYRVEYFNNTDVKNDAVYYGSVKYTLPPFSMLVYGSTPTVATGDLGKITCYNVFELNKTERDKCRVGLEIDLSAEPTKIIGLLENHGTPKQWAIVVDRHVLDSELPLTAGSFSFTAASYDRVYDVHNIGSRPQGVKFGNATILNYIGDNTETDFEENSGSVLVHMKGLQSFLAPQGSGAYPCAAAIGNRGVSDQTVAHVEMSIATTAGSHDFTKGYTYSFEGGMENPSILGDGDQVVVTGIGEGSSMMFNLDMRFLYNTNDDHCLRGDYKSKRNSYIHMTNLFLFKDLDIDGVNYSGNSNHGYTIGKNTTNNMYGVYDSNAQLIVEVGCDPLTGLQFHNNAWYFHASNVMYKYVTQIGLISYKTEDGLTAGTIHDNKYLVALPDRIIGIDTDDGRPMDLYEIADVQSFMVRNCDLFFLTSTTEYKLDRGSIYPKGYLVSSVYGRYMGSIKKNWIRSKVLVNQPLDATGAPVDMGQKIRFAVSYDGGKSYHYIAKELDHPLIPLNYGNPVPAAYEVSFADFQGDIKDEAVFRFPWLPANSHTISYRVEIYQDSLDFKENFVIKHVEVQYLLNNFKEYILQFLLQLQPRQGLLDKSIEQVRLTHKKKLDFIKTVREGGHKCRLTMPWGETIYVVPFSSGGDFGGGSDGYGISVSNIEPARNDLNSLIYTVNMTFKSISDLDDNEF